MICWASRSRAGVVAPGGKLRPSFRAGRQAAAPAAAESHRDRRRLPGVAQAAPTAADFSFSPESFGALLSEERQRRGCADRAPQITFHSQNLARAGCAVPWSVSDTHRFPRARGIAQGPHELPPGERRPKFPGLDRNRPKINRLQTASGPREASRCPARQPERL